MLKHVGGKLFIAVGNTRIPVYELKGKKTGYRANWKEPGSGKVRQVFRKSLSNLVDTVNDIAASLDRQATNLDGLTKEQVLLCKAFLELQPTWGLVDRLRAEAALKKATYGTVLENFLADKSSSPKASGRYVRSLKVTLNQLLARFADTPMIEISAGDLDEWILGQDRWNDISKSSARSTIITLFRWARKEQHLPDMQTTEAEKMADNYDTKIAKKTFAPEDLHQMLVAVGAQFHPWLCLRAYAGLREAEVYRDATDEKDVVRWEDIEWDDGVIVVREDVAKTNDERLVPMCEALRTQLEPYRKKGLKGPVCLKSAIRGKGEGYATGISETKRLSEEAGIEWVRNGLRKSHLTYLIALKGRATAAHYCGTSEETVRKFYQEPLKSRISRAESWFEIKPIPPQVGVFLDGES